MWQTKTAAIIPCVPPKSRGATCPICGRRVNRPRHYIRHVGQYAFPWGMLPDHGAGFSLVHPRCVRKACLAEDYLYSPEERARLEQEAE